MKTAHPARVPIYWKLQIRQTENCNSSRPRTRTNFSAIKKLFFLRNPHGYPCGFVLQLDGCQFSFLNIYWKYSIFLPPSVTIASLCTLNTKWCLCWTYWNKRNASHTQLQWQTRVAKQKHPKQRRQLTTFEKHTDEQITAVQNAIMRYDPTSRHGWSRQAGRVVAVTGFLSCIMRGWCALQTLFEECGGAGGGGGIRGGWD